MPTTKKKANRRGRTNVAIKDEHSEVLKQYSKLSGIPLDEMLDECLSEYIEVTIETGYEDLADRAATA